MWELDYKESWASKNWCLWIVVLVTTLENPLHCKEIKLVNPKENQSWIFIWADAEAETPILWPPDAELTYWKIPWCWERLKAGREGTNRGWGGWMASSTLWTWVWVSSWKWWSTGKPGMPPYIGVQSWSWLSDWTKTMFVTGILSEIPVQSLFIRIWIIVTISEKRRGNICTKVLKFKGRIVSGVYHFIHCLQSYM